MCITRIKCGVEKCRHGYHMPEVLSGLLTVTAEAQSYNPGKKGSVRGNRQWGGGKRVNGKEKKEHVGRLKIQRYENKSRQTEGQGGRNPHREHQSPYAEAPGC